MTELEAFKAAFVRAGFRMALSGDEWDKLLDSFREEGFHFEG